MLLGDKVLGYGWHHSSEVMITKFPIYLTNKKRKTRMDTLLTPQDLQTFSKAKITRRICLGITNGFGDFLGIASPFSIRFTLLMKELFYGNQKQPPWDDEVQDKARESWVESISDTIDSNDLCFPRSVQPGNAVGQPTVVGFCDGAFNAYSLCI